MERLGVERARLLSDNIELDRRAGELVEEIRRGRRIGARGWPSRKPRCAPISRRSKKRSSSCASTSSRRRRSAPKSSWSWCKKQAELKYLDETSRKELNAPLEELAAGEEAVLDEAGLAGSRAEISGSEGAH